MKYWILAISLFILGCGGGESGGSDATTTEDVVEEGAQTMGDATADAINEVQESAEEVGDMLEEKKDQLDEELDKVEEAVKD